MYVQARPQGREPVTLFVVGSGGGFVLFCFVCVIFFLLFCFVSNNASQRAKGFRRS